MALVYIKDDITNLKTDAIVNAANTSLLAGSGVCGAIFRKAGLELLQEACNKLSPINTGEAVITPGFNLKAKYVIHTAGPIYIDGNHNEKSLLENAYKNSLKLALENNLKSIAFPLLSAGIYGYPQEEAFLIASRTIREFLGEIDYDLDVFLVIFDDSIFDFLKKIDNDFNNYLKNNLLRKSQSSLVNFKSDDNEIKYSIKPFGSAISIRRKKKFKEELEDFVCKEEAAFSQEKSLQEIFEDMGKPFKDMLLEFIRKQNMENTQVYKNANLDRRLFSKIINPKNDYSPSKNTVFALLIGLKLNYDDSLTLLKSAGYTFADNEKLDLAIKYFIENKFYDIDKINFILYQNSITQLGLL